MAIIGILFMITSFIGFFLKKEDMMRGGSIGATYDPKHETLAQQHPILHYLFMGVYFLIGLAITLSEFGIISDKWMK
jgi:hypothetical protein